MNGKRRVCLYPFLVPARGHRILDLIYAENERKEALVYVKLSRVSQCILRTLFSAKGRLF